MRFVVVAISLSLISPVFGQIQQSYLQNAKEHFEIGEYREALYFFNKYIEKDSSNHIAYCMRGQCRMELNMLNLALGDYTHAAKLSPTYAQTYFSMGILYEVQQKYDSAEKYFRIASDQDTKNLDAFLHLANTLKNQGREDAMTPFLETAYALDNTNIKATHLLAKQYFYLNRFQDAIALCKAGIQLDALDINFYFISGMSNIELENYSAAIEQFRLILSIDATDFDAHRLYLKAKILQKTPPQYLEKKDHTTFYLTNGTSSNNLSGTLNYLENPDNIHVHDRIEKRIRKGEILGLHEYQLYYLSQVKAPQYRPYNRPEHLIFKLFQEKQFEEISRLAPSLFETNPINIDEAYGIALANFMIRKMDEFHLYYALYLGLVESILKSGDGLSANTALVVVSPTDEYAILNYYGLRSQMQSLITKEGHHFDMLNVKDPQGNDYELYYNIDIPFKVLLGTVNTDTPGEKKEKPTKRKKNQKKSKKKIPLPTNDKLEISSNW